MCPLHSGLVILLISLLSSPLAGPNARRGEPHTRADELGLVAGETSGSSAATQGDGRIDFGLKSD